MPDPTPLPAMPPPPSGLARKRTFVILIVGALVVALGLGAMTAWRNRQNQPPPANSTTNQSADTNTVPRPTFSRFTIRQVNDRDGDGLTDEEERTAHTNPDQADTDGDGLTDTEEVKVYHTNPAKQDSDGDGHPDGQEVESGNNPSGAGLLRNLPAAIKSLTNQ